MKLQSSISPRKVGEINRIRILIDSTHSRLSFGARFIEIRQVFAEISHFENYEKLENQSFLVFRNFFPRRPDHGKPIENVIELQTSISPRKVGEIDRIRILIDSTHPGLSFATCFIQIRPLVAEISHIENRQKPRKS